MIFSIQSVVSQDGYLKFKPYKPYQWMVGAGWSFLDNDGRPYSHIFNFRETWVANFYPSHLIVDRYLKHDISLELDLSFNHFNGRKMINLAYTGGMQLSADLHARFGFYRYLKTAKWLDPYLGFGVGLTYSKGGGTGFYPTANAFVGVNFWMKDVGIRLQGTPKLGLTPPIYRSGSNYIQYTAAVVYRFQTTKKNNSGFDKPRYKWTRKKNHGGSPK